MSILDNGFYGSIGAFKYKAFNNSVLFRKNTSSPTPLPLPSIWLTTSDESTITESGGIVSEWRDNSGNDISNTITGLTYDGDVMKFDSSGKITIPMDSIADNGGITMVFTVGRTLEVSNNTLFSYDDKVNGDVGTVLYRTDNIGGRPLMYGKSKTITNLGLIDMIDYTKENEVILNLRTLDNGTCTMELIVDNKRDFIVDTECDFMLDEVGNIILGVGKWGMNNDGGTIRDFKLYDSYINDMSGFNSPKDDIFIIAFGQSNTVGFEDTEIGEIPSNVLFYIDTGLTEKFWQARTKFKGFSFYAGVELAKLYPDKMIRVFQHGVSGSPLEPFQKGDISGYYAQIMQNIVDGTAMMENYDKKLDLIMMHQGEANASNTQEYYLALLESIMDDLKSEPVGNLNAPYIVGDLTNVNSNYDAMSEILRTKNTDGNNLTACALVSNSEPRGDQAHFSALGYSQGGTIYASKMKELLDGTYTD